MEFDAFTVAFLLTPENEPELSDEEAAELQDAHMNHLRELQASGKLLAAGPVGDAQFRGLSILACGPEEALALTEADPAVQRGRFTVQVVPWNVPAGVIAFPGEVALPRSVAEVRG